MTCACGKTLSTRHSKTGLCATCLKGTPKWHPTLVEGKWCTVRRNVTVVGVRKERTHAYSTDPRAVIARAYSKKPNGFLVRTYRNMLSRVKGIQKSRAHLYRGFTILPRDDFYRWARRQSSFIRLFEAWVSAGYERGLTPSIDRIDPQGGYFQKNLRWVTLSENASAARHFS